MQVATAQINPIVGDLEGNFQKIAAVIAKASKSDLIVFPELSLTGYPPEDLLLYPHFIKKIALYREKMLPLSKGKMVVVGLVHEEKGRLYNAADVYQDGKFVGTAKKILLPTYDVFDERRYFTPGLEPQVFTWKGKKVGILICEDIWHHAQMAEKGRYNRDPVLEIAEEKPDLLLNLSASPYHFEKPHDRYLVGVKVTSTLKCPLIYACQVGGNDQLVFDGYSLAINAHGEIFAQAKGFEEDLLFCDPFSPAPFQPQPTDPIGDLFHALVLGVRDYFKKSGFSTACLGLSGGIDSAVVACIAKEALGKENVLALAMPSRFSSEGSHLDAAALARNLAISYKEISIEKPFSTYLELLKPHFENRPEDVTEENLQARIRGMILMAFSNKFGSVVLSTGNKSEMALGYCTLYGDMVGGLGVLSDVTKKQVFMLARWINRKQEIIPKNTIEKPPSAELKANQKDSDALPPYDIIDTVLEEYVIDHLSPEEIAKKHAFDSKLVSDLIDKIHKAEYKRRQAPIGIRVSRKAFGVGRRFPIVEKMHGN